jgi:hypothetical protein
MQETFSNRIINPVDLARLNLTVSESLTSAFDDKLTIATVTINESAVSLAPTILEDLPINKEINKPQISRKRENDKTNRKEQKTAFSIFAGSYFNYAEGSEKQLNYSAGVTSDIRLSKNLKFSTGLNIASNSLSYGKSLPENASNSSDFSAIKAGAASVGNFTNLINYHATLLVLDFPVNIKYQFYPESDKFYVSAGLSSGTYLTESYVYQYINFNPTSGNYVSGPQNQKEKKQLNDFDLGRTLNFSLGLNTPFGKKQTISIEPYLKYPLGGLGSENLKFGSMGINLKFHFKPITKQ